MENYFRKHVGDQVDSQDGRARLAGVIDCSGDQQDTTIDDEEQGTNTRSRSRTTSAVSTLEFEDVKVAH